MPSKRATIRRALRRESRMELGDVLDTFEARVRAKWAISERRILAARAVYLRESIDGDDPDRGIGSLKPNLSFYDGHVEYHGQD